MDRQKLQQLRKLRKERESLKERLDNHRFNPKEEVADTVKDYRTGQGKTVVVRGYGDEQWKKLQMKYLEKVGRLTSEILRMEMFLDKVQDAEMRQILRYRYEDGMTHAEVGEKMGYSRETIQKKEWRFWNEMDEDGE